jgi:haloacetate dehalogenase
VRGGAGPAVLLLHGYPQTHAMWHRVAPDLAEHFTVVCPDLRGYGDSAKPPGGHDHLEYSKRAMAMDQVAVMSALGFERFAVVGHDRGARVAFRMALDHPERVSRLAYLAWTLDEWCGTAGALTEQAVTEYRRCFDDATIHATCEDYRAGASIDLLHDDSDADAVLRCPALVLWSKTGIDDAFDVPGIWRERAPDLRGRAFDCGHFLAEERPDETTADLERSTAAQARVGARGRSVATTQ